MQYNILFVVFLGVASVFGAPTEVVTGAVNAADGATTPAVDIVSSGLALIPKVIGVTMRTETATINAGAGAFRDGAGAAANVVEGLGGNVAGGVAANIAGSSSNVVDSGAAAAVSGLGLGTTVVNTLFGSSGKGIFSG